MKYLFQLILLSMALFITSCECDIDSREICPCIYEDDQPPYYKSSCETIGEKADQWSCMVDGLIADVYQELKYPDTAKENCTEGLVAVAILINEKGEFVKSEIRTDSILGDGLEEEALRMVNTISGNWCPGLINCEPVEKEFVLPIRFKLSK